MKFEEIEVGNRKYRLRISIEPRESSTASIGTKQINIRIPAALSREEQFREKMRLKNWVAEKLKEKPIPAKKTKEHFDGEEITSGNHKFTLKITYKPKKTSSAQIRENTIEMAISEDLPKERQTRAISTLLSRCLARKHGGELRKRVMELNETHFKKNLNRIFIKNLQSCWGSCSEDNNINLSTRLFFTPQDIVNYVCIHELAHLEHKNHSKEFWDAVEKAMPNYRDKKQWLKENSNQAVL